MGGEPMDYTAILNDLESKKTALEQTIASLRQAMAFGALGQGGDSSAQPSLAASPFGGEVPTGAFLGKSIPEAAKLYLEIVKKKQTTKEIADALEKGGMETNSKSFTKTVHTALTRARQGANASLVQVGKHWGLVGWFPKGVVSGVGAAKPSKTKKKKAAAKPSMAAGAKTVAPEQPAAAVKPEKHTAAKGQKKGGTREQIVAVLEATPGVELTAKDIAEKTGMKIQVAHMCLGQLVNAHRAEKTASGAYRVPTPQSATHAVA